MFGYSGENIDLSRYYISDTDWSIGYRINNISNQYIDFNVFFDEYGNQVIPTVLFNDSDIIFFSCIFNSDLTLVNIGRADQCPETT